VSKGIPSGAWTETRIAESCIGLLRSAEDDFGLDDVLWCYAYEPRCQKLRQMVYKACGVTNKKGLIDWDIAHSHCDRIAILEGLF
jgi:hypothetical protein